MRGDPMNCGTLLVATGGAHKTAFRRTLHCPPPRSLNPSSMALPASKLVAFITAVPISESLKVQHIDRRVAPEVAMRFWVDCSSASARNEATTNCTRARVRVNETTLTDDRRDFPSKQQQHYLLR